MSFVSSQAHLGILRKTPTTASQNNDKLKTALECVPSRAITIILAQYPKTGIPGPFEVKNGYSLESSQKYTRRATRLAKNKSYPFFRDYDPGTPVHGYYARLGFQPFLIICYSEYLFCTVPGSLRLRSLFSFGFWFIFALQFFTTSFISLYSTIMRTRLRRSIC